MCQRWQQLGAFYTFSRNHNGENFAPQDPGYFGEEVARVTRETLLIRYTLLPYLYTLMYDAHTTGKTVIRSLMFEFRNDANVLDITDQFLWGPAFLISPVLDEATTSIQAYFPNARWYSYYDGDEVGVSGGFSQLDAPLDFIPLHVRGGYILPTQQPANTTMTSRNNPLGLIVALDETGQASGSRFWDDGDELDSHLNGNYVYETYSCSAGVLQNTVEHDGYPEADNLELDDIRIFGATSSISTVTINSNAHSDWDQDAGTMAITIRNANIQFTTDFEVTWA
jgi:alpha-glucosidase (family GH31 glycosyl hydrolase)